MISLPGILVKTQIHESVSSVVYQGIREDDNQSIIIKVLKQDYPTPQELARYRTEYEITKSLNLTGVVKVYNLQKYQNTLVMSLEDFGGKSLKFWRQHQFSLEEFLQIAIATTESLGQVHSANIIHKDINPSNIIFNPETKQLKLIDFGIATQLTRENPTLNNPNILEGTLAYISPEQTGRMNRSIDYRTDFYSLGVTFYELLTNQLPFETTDALELVHCHIAKQPLNPCLINPEIPAMVAAIVMKLMAKTAEERYQSALGIKADLEKCLALIEDYGTISDFILASQDIADKFQIPQKLYGRETEITALINAFKRVKYKNEIVLISGYSGIGKTALVQELYKPITENRGYFISGKFDQFQTNIPYSAIVAAFQELVKQLLTEPEAKLKEWQNKIIKALGINGQVVIDVIPQLELVIGKQPVASEVGATETANRFNLVFQNFIQVFTDVNHPLVLFLDDLQWVDSASLKLIEFLTNNPESKYLLLIVTYRDNEVDASHPLRETIATLIDSGITINELTLTPLQLNEIEQLLKDTLRNETSEKITILAELLLEKTHGNPFFMNEFLKSLYSEGLLQFDSQKRCWQWQLSQIESAQMTDNVVDFMAQKIQKLPPSYQESLKFAACIGNEFDLQTLALIRQETSSLIATQLWDAVQLGLISPQGKDYHLLKITDSSNDLNVVYNFQHDRVQQAAYSLIPPEQKQQLHWQIGQIIYQKLTERQREEQIFDLVNHLNQGVSLIEDGQKRRELAELNLVAGKKAKVATAYDQSLVYLITGINCLETNLWQQEYKLALDLHQTAAEVAYLAGEFEQMDQLISQVLVQGKTLLEQVQVYIIKIQSLITRDRLVDAAQEGLELLKRLGNSLPSHPSSLQIRLGLLRIKLALGGKSVASLVNLPTITNPTQLASIRVLSSIASATYLALPEIFPLTVFKQVELSARYGNAPESAFAYATYGLILCGVVGDLQTGCAFGNLSLQLIEKFQAKALKSRTLSIVNSFVRHWREPLQNTLTFLAEGFQVGREMGDTEYASWNAHMYTINAYFSGQPLPNVAQSLHIYAEAIGRFKKLPILTFIQLYQQIVANLQGKNQEPWQLVGKFYDVNLNLPQYIETNYRTAIFYVYANNLHLNYLFDNYAVAVEQADQATLYLESVIALFITGWFTFYDALARLALAENRTGKARQLLLNQVKKNQHQLQKWAKSAPSNYAHKLALVKGEKYRIKGELIKAIAAYEQAITLAEENGYIQEAALANELIAKLYLHQNRLKLAKLYLQEARYLYLQWGAIAKVKYLEQQYPQLLVISEITIKNGRNNVNVTTRDAVSNLDIAAVMKGSQAISEEIVLDKLLANLMKILIENAGAEKGYLIVEKQGKLLIEAEGTIEYEQVTVLQSLGVYNCQKVSTAIVNYVIRTQEMVVLNNATTAGGFTQDIYIQENQSKSVLCVPLIHQGKLISIIYLENNLTTGAFNAERVEVIKLLSSSAAISIENAKLYQEVRENESHLAQLNSDLEKSLASELKLKSAASRFVPNQLLSFLGYKSLTEVKLGDSVQLEMSVLFSDIRDFTTLSEKLNPEDNFLFINSYLSRMEPVITENQGFIDKYIGDAIMALFSGEADNAVKAGISMLKRLAEYNQELSEYGFQKIKIGIGIHTGSLMLGTVGGQNRMDGTVISDAVNLASRVESLTKNYGVALLITQQTFEKLTNPHNYAIRIIDTVKVKGKSKPVTVHEVFDADDQELKAGKLATLNMFTEAMQLYHQGDFSEAGLLFASCLRDNPRDGIAKIYFEKVNKAHIIN